MKFYKLLLVTVLSCFALSCSQDKFEDQTTVDSSERLAAGQFDDSYLGVYKGLFSTNDGLTRGSVVVTLSPNNEAVAQVTLSSGETIELVSSKVKLTADNKVSNLRFSSVGLSPVSATLDFSVDGNGMNPSVSNVMFDNKESDILIAKNLSRVPLTPITGTFDCTDCASQGVGFPNNRTWNIMSIGTGNQSYMTQVSYGGRIYTSPGTQNGCFNFQGYDVCNIEGSLVVLGFDVSWDGTHIYDGSDEFACSEVSGVWSAPGYGPGVTGTFQSDSDCDTSVRLPLTCGEILEDNGGAADYANNSDDSHAIDAGAGNLVSLPFTVFNLENGWDFMRIYNSSDGVTLGTEITDVNGRVIADFGSRGIGFTGTGTGANSLEGQTVVSSGQFLVITFKSDSSVTRPGFSAVVGCNPARLGVSNNIRTSDTFMPSISLGVPKGTE